MAETEGDKLAELEHKIRNWRLPSEIYHYFGMMFIGIASVSNILRWQKGWKEEELGIWFNLCFWGGYMLGIGIMLHFGASMYVSYRSFERALEEFETERAKRGNAPRVIDEKAGGHDEGIV